MTAYHIALYVCLLLLGFGGVAITLVNLPGLWLIVAALGVYELLTHHAFASWRTLLAMLIAAGVAEYLEITSSGRSAKKAGASRRGVWGAILGAIVGGIALTPLIPIPVVGTIIGLLAGAFAGAAIAELTGGTHLGTSLKVGLFAAKGRATGLLIKFIFGVVMLITVAITAFPHDRQVTPQLHVPPATTRSATAAS